MEIEVDTEKKTIYAEMTHEELARQLLAVNHTEERRDQYWEDFATTFVASLGVGIEKSVVRKVAQDLKKEMPSVIDVAVPIYMRYFSPEELISLIEVCNRPAVQKMDCIRHQLSLEVSATMGMLASPKILEGVLDRHLGRGKW
jgi:tRNA A37 threonylcarbamoyladenosine dehydratase